MTTAIQTARKVVRDRERQQRDELIQTEARRIEHEAARQKARDEAHAKRVAAEAAERQVRESDLVVVILRYGGVVVTGRPEWSADHVVRNSVNHALSQCAAIFNREAEHLVGVARASAQGVQPRADVRSPIQLVTELRDVCRRAIAYGALTVEIQ